MGSLQRDTSGAIMVIAIFMAVIAIGALYYMAGLGDAILAQERMQDAADASAFSSAVIHARGMNVLALINIMMASLLAILVLLSMLSSLFTTAVVVLAAISWLIPAAIPLIPPANAAARGFKQAENRAKGPVQETVKAMHKLQEPLSKAIPILASLNAAKMSRLNYGKVVEFGVTFPIMDGLPTREGDFKILCEKAGSYAGDLVAIPIAAVIPSKWFADKLRSGSRSLGKKYAAFYCGGAPKPTAKIFTEDVSIPEFVTEAGVRCKDPKNDNSDADCKLHEDELNAMLTSYDESKAECKTDSSMKKQCDNLRIEARTECNPAKKTPKIRASTWMELRYTRRWMLQGEGKSARVVEVDRDKRAVKKVRDKRDDDYSKRDKKSNPSPGVTDAKTFNGPLWQKGIVPCGSRFGYQGSPMSSWNGLKDDDGPLCASEVKTPTIAEFEFDKGRVHEVRVLEIVDILRCTIKKDIEAKLNGDPLTATDKQGMAPQEMCSCAALGEESFQIRSIVLGDPGEYTKNSDQSILVATGGKQAAPSAIASLGEYASKIAAAQAEYYFNDDNAPPAEWLWKMKWRARMRRLTFDREPFECKVRDNCQTGQNRAGKKGNGPQSDAIKNFKALLGNADSIIVH